MTNHPGRLWGLAFLLLACAARLPAQAAQTERAGTGSVTVAIADFTGQDRDLANTIVDSLITDLDQSTLLRVLERTEALQGMADLNLTAADLSDPYQAKRLCRAIHADRLIIGSSSVRGSQLIINARLLDASAGRSVPGAASNISGNSRDVLVLVHRLARNLHRRITGANLRLDDAQPDTNSAPAMEPDTTERDTVPDRIPEPVPAPRRTESGLIPAGVRSGSPVTERDLAALVRRLSVATGNSVERAVSVTNPTSTVTRLRVVAALAKSVASPDELDALRDAPVDRLPEDEGDIPAWGRAYAAYAVDSGWWPADRPLRSRDTAPWAFVKALVDNMPNAPKSEQNDSADTRSSERYTGLVIDARDLNLQRTMGPRILDEDGNVLYPDTRHVPNDDSLQDRGMAAYNRTLREATRAGSHPLVITALDTAGAGRDDIVVSNADAALLRQADRRNRFLAKWAVVILVADE